MEERSDQIIENIFLLRWDSLQLTVYWVHQSLKDLWYQSLKEFYDSETVITRSHLHNHNLTFSIRSIVCSRSIPKSINSQWIPSFLYSSCSRTNMWWLKNCWSFSFVKLIHNCSKELYWKNSRKYAFTQFRKSSSGWHHADAATGGV